MLGFFARICRNESPVHGREAPAWHIGRLISEGFIELTADQPFFVK
jgi:hypothetical protein